MYKAQKPRDDTDRLCVSRKEERRLVSIENCVEASIQNLKKYTKRSKERLITVVINSRVRTNRKRIKQKWEVKELYGYFKGYIMEIAHEMIKTWLRKGNIKREYESILTTAQNKVFNTNYDNVKFDNIQQNSQTWLSSWFGLV